MTQLSAMLNWVLRYNADPNRGVCLLRQLICHPRFQSLVCSEQAGIVHRCFRRFPIHLPHRGRHIRLPVEAPIELDSAGGDQLIRQAPAVESFKLLHSCS